MSDVVELLELAESSNKKDRRDAAKNMGDLPRQSPPVMDKLRDMAENDDDKKVRQEAEKSLQKLSSKPMDEVDATKEVEIDESTMRAGEDFPMSTGEYDVDSDLSKQEEDMREAAAAGKGLRVRLVERNFVTMNYYGDKVEQTGSKGKILVANTGSRNRIYGVDLELENTDRVRSETELDTKNRIGILRPGADNAWTAEYEFEKEVQPLKVEQLYQDPETGLSPNFAGGDEKSFTATITISNTTDETIKNIVGEKTINDLGRVSNSSASVGSTSQEGSVVKFTIDELGAGATATVEISISAALPDDVPSYKSGVLKVTYENEGTLGSGLSFKAVDGVSDIQQNVTRKQRETEPGYYDCQINFKNTSEFVYDLNRFAVFAGSYDTSDIVLDWDGTNVSEDEREIVPGEEVDFKFIYESPHETPTFGNYVVFSVQSEIQMLTKTEITLPAEELRFMALSITKSFMMDGESVGRYEVNSYVETEVPTMLVVKGVGSYPIEGLMVTDEIPDGFRPPVDDQITVSRQGADLSTGEYQSSIEGNQLKLQFEHLEETSFGGLKEDEEITIKYVQIAENPTARDEKIETTSYAEGFVYVAPDAKVKASTTNEELELVVVHLRDNLDILKATEGVDYNGGDGYSIRLNVENSGSSTVKIFLEDLIPNGFSFVDGTFESEPEAEISETRSHSEGEIRGVTFSHVGPSETAWVKYMVVQDDPEADPKKLQAVFRG